jgi:hypothetical protein
MADEAGRPTTNIGATDMRRVPAAGRPTTARKDGDAPPDEARRLHPAPEWISRWQRTATVPASRGPFITGYRFWRARLAYEDSNGKRVGPGITGPATDWIDCMHKSGHMRRHYVPEGVANAFVQAIQRNISIGQWCHRNLLQNGRNRYPGVDL